MSIFGKIATATFLGALTGAVIALQLSGGFCWLGFLIGGVVGYFAYQPQEVIKALPSAWTTASKAAGIVWGQPINKLRLTFWTILMSLWTFGNLFVFWLFLNHNPLISFGFAVWNNVIFLAWLAPEDRYTPFAEKWENAQKLRSSCIMMLLTSSFVFPFSIIFLIVCGLILAVRYLVRTVPAIVKLIASNVKKVIAGLPEFCRVFLTVLLFLVHSDLRLLCGFNAMVGSIVGYCLGRAVTGAVIATLAACGMYYLAGKILARWTNLAITD